MLKSPIHKFQSIVTHRPNRHLKQKKRRKKRNKLRKNTNLDFNSLFLKTSTINVSKRHPINKTKQYYQHDNRLGQSKNQSKQTLLTSSEMFSKNGMEREIHYKEVAKKFKPANNVKKNTDSKKQKQAFLKNLKTYKNKLAFRKAVNELENKSTISPTTTIALMQPQFCICSCRNEQKIYNSNFHCRSRNFELQAAVFANINNKLSSSLVNNCSHKLPSFKIDCKTGLNHLDSEAPIMFLDSFIDNTEIFKYFNESSSVRDTHLLEEAQQDKTAKLREDFNNSENFVEGSSLDSDRKSKEDIAKSLALQRKLLDQREETTQMATKETSKLYALVGSSPMEHDLPKDVAPDKSNNLVKKKRKKKIRERLPSPEQKKDKKKKSKKNKKESKPKKSKKVRRRKGSESETNAENDFAEYSRSNEIEVDMKRSRKKTKKDKKKRRNKQTTTTVSMSPLDKIDKYKKCETLNETNYYDYRSRSRSKEISIKLKELQTHSYESLHNRSRQHQSLNNRKNSRSYSRSNKTTSNNHDDWNEVEDLNLKHSSSLRAPRCRVRNISPVKNLKREHNDKHLYRKGETSSTDKRKRYSQSQSSSITGRSCENTFLPTTENESNVNNRQSRTPNRQRSVYRSKLNTSLSRSSSRKSSLKNSSLSPRSQTSKKNKPLINEKNINCQTKSNIITNINKENLCKTSRSRSISLSSHTTSITNSIISISRTPSPKIGYLETFSVFNSLESQRRKEQKLNFSSPDRTPTLKQKRSTSILQTRFTIKEKDTKTNRSSKESLSCRKEHEKSRTTPKIEKKMTSPRSSRDSSELSYSPGRKNPERCRDILENNKIRKVLDNVEDRREIEWDRKEKGPKNESNQAKPVVRLHSQSDEESDAPERNTEKLLDEFQEYKRERELNELKMLEHLKTGLAAKAKEKIKTIEKMAASTSEHLSSNNDGETSDKSHKRIVRNSLNEFLAANNVTPALVATCTYNGISNSPVRTIYPQTFEEIKKEQDAVSQLAGTVNSFNDNNDSKKDIETMVDCKKSLITANLQVPSVTQVASPFRSSSNITNKEKDRKRERDMRERERESYNFNKDRYLERRHKSIPGFYTTGGGGIVGGTFCGGNMGGGRRNTNSNMLNINHRQRLNLMCNSGVVGAHHNPHSHLHPHHHHPNHKLINSQHNSAASSFFLTNNSTNTHTLLCNHLNNSTNISFNRPSRINNTPLITATQFNNQMLSKQSNSILVNRRDHRTALNLGLSGTPCTNFSNSNLLLTKANTNAHHLHAATVGHVVSGGHHHIQTAGMSSGCSSSATQITDRILMAASFAAAQRHSFGVHSTVTNAAAVVAANNLNFLHQQNTPKLILKPFKINDSQPLVAALADSSLVDAIVSKVSTATVAAAESAARRSRSRSRRSRSRNRNDEKSSASNSGDGKRRRSQSRSRSSRSSSSSRSRGRSHGHRSSRSQTSQSSSTTHTSSRSSSSSSFGTSRSGTRSPSIPRRRGSPSFLDRRRITSARKRPIPYHRKLSSDVSSCYCSSCCSRESTPQSRSPSRDSRSPSRFFETSFLSKNNSSY